MTRRAAQKGFTLVELMVALAIFGILAAAGVSLLGFSVRAQGAVQDRLDEVAAVRRLGAILTADLAQAAPRLTRSPDGSTRVAFFGGPGGEGQLAMAFTRRGWDNPQASPRASLQRVEYRLVGDRIERRAAPMLDGADWGAPSVILRGVKSFALRYRGKNEWRDNWDPERPGDLPRAVEAVADIEGLGRVRQVFIAGVGT